MVKLSTAIDIITMTIRKYQAEIDVNCRIDYYTGKNHPFPIYI